jgi:DnaJ-class molecular chaperone
MSLTCALHHLSIKLPHIFQKAAALSEDEIKCPACGGSGVIVTKHQAQLGKRIIVRCAKCQGKGRVKKEAD